MDTRFKNQSGLLDRSKLNKSVIVIGAGAIGSFYSMTLAKMGFTDITVYDADKIEDHNIANQMYPESNIGRLKVEALKDLCMRFAGVTIKPIPAMWHPDNAQNAEIVVMSVDNMDARSAIWRHYGTREGTKLVVDGRMGAQVFRAYAVDTSIREEREFYQSTLYPQSEASPERCTMKTIIFTVLSVSGVMLSLTKKWVMNEFRPTEIIYDCVNDEILKEFKAHKPLELPQGELHEHEQVGNGSVPALG